MTHRHIRAVPLAALALVAAACGSSSTQPAPSLSVIVTASQVDGPAAGAEFLQAIDDVPDSPSLEALMAADGVDASSDPAFYGKAVAWMAYRLLDGYSVKAVKMNYQARAIATDGSAETRWLSGAVFLPDPDGDDLPVPIVIYTHGTELKKSLVASKGIHDGGYSREAGGMEGLIGIHFASAGPAIVAMPDYQGMGVDDRHYHPYVHLQSLAWAGHDMVTAVLERLKANDGSFAPKGVRWNGKVHVIGYSEGGYAAMAFTREWVRAQSLNGTGFPLDCAAPMAGPHSLSGRMKAVMTNGTDDFPVPFFLPYMLYGYQSVYPTVVKPREAVLAKFFTMGLDTWMSGLFTGVQADQQIVNANGGPVKMRAMMYEDWVLANLFDEGSPVHRTIVENDTIAHPGDANAWLSPIPIYLIHSRTDDLVPFGNSDDASTFMAESPGGIHLRTQNWSWWDPAHGTVHFNPRHGEAAPLALAGGFYWLMNGCRE